MDNNMRTEEHAVKGIRKLWPVMLALLLTVMVWVLGLGRSDVVFPDMHWDGLKFSGSDKTYSLADGDEYGLLSSGPGFTLPAGRYRLLVTVDCDADNAVKIVTSNNAKAEPAELILPAQSWNNSLDFELKEDARDLQLRVDFRAGSYLKLHDFDLVMLGKTDGAWTFTIIAALFCAVYLCWTKGWLTREGMARLLLIGAAVLLSSVPVLMENVYGGHDTLFHQMRLYNVVDALRTGQFPVRMGGYGYNGYGSAVSVFYPDVFLYFPALMMLAGATVQCAMRTYIIAVNAVAAAAMYVCGKRMFASRTAGTCASILYTLAGYRLMDIYLRDALGEYTAMAILPVFVLGLWEVVFGDRKRWRTLVLGASLVFLSHMLTTVMCACLAVCFCLVGAVKIVREKRFAPILKAALMTVLVCLFALVPVLDYSMQGIGDSGTFSTQVSATAIEAMELFVTEPGYDRGLGGALVIGTVVLAYAALMGCGDKQRMRNALFCAGVGAAAAFASTKLFPWALMERLTHGLVNYLQFPYRLMMFADVFLALAAGWGLVCLMGERPQRLLAALLTLMLCTICVYPQLGGYSVRSADMPVYGARNADHYIRYKSYTSTITSSYLEYALPGSDLSATKNQKVKADGVDVTGYAKNGTDITAQVAAKEDGTLTLPLFGFDGYRAELDGEDVAWTLGENNRLTVQIPAGAQGELRVWFAGKPLWRAAEAVSLLAALGLILLSGRRKLQCKG